MVTSVCAATSNGAVVWHFDDSTREGEGVANTLHNASFDKCTKLLSVRVYLGSYFLAVLSTMW